MVDRALRNALVAGGLSVAFLVFVAMVILLFNPPTDLDRACLNSSARDMSQCVAEFNRRRP